MWNIFVVIFCVSALVFNSILWVKYRRITVKENQKKEGWNQYYFMASLLIITVLLNRIGEL